MPFAVADAVVRRGRRVVLFGIEGAADAKRIRRYPHHWIVLGKVGRLLSLMKEEGCRDAVVVGSLVRPAFWSIRLDFKTLMLLPKAAAAFRGGDNHLLTSLVRIAEELGFRILAPHEVAPDILAPAGNLTRKKPSARDKRDIARGLKLVKAISAFDVGQAAVVANDHVLAVEGIGGTDQMLAHLSELRRIGRLRQRQGIGVLVKAPKLRQDRRYDMPAVGPKTVEAAVKAGLAGIAIVAGAAVMAEPERMIAAADKAKLFIVGVETSR